MDKLKAKRFRERTKEKHKTQAVDDTIKEKKCIGDICKGKLVPVKKFSKDCSKPDGYQVRCKDCAKYIADKNKTDNEHLNINTTYKICSSGDSGCGKKLSLSNFDKCKTGKYGYNNMCNECRKVQRQNTYEPKKTGTKKCSLCGKPKDVSNFHIDKHNSPDGLASGCKVCRLIQARESNSKFPNFITQTIKNARSNAKKRKLLFSITTENIIDLYKTQNGKCAITDVLMTYNQKEREDTDAHILNPTNMSIDRIDSSKGYTIDNIQLVCAAINKIKYTMSTLELQNLTADIKSHKINKDKENNVLQDQEPIEIIDTIKKVIQKKLRSTKYNRRDGKIKVNITYNDIVDKYVSQNGKCAISVQTIPMSYQ